MDSNDKFVLLIISIPLAGLVYSGLGISLMVNSPVVRNYPLISGAIFVLIPFVSAVSIWMTTAAKRYKQK
ncbi:MAG: hypothetical protein ACFB02_03105 [Mastigocoleus sp.]